MKHSNQPGDGLLGGGAVCQSESKGRHNGGERFFYFDWLLVFRLGGMGEGGD